MSELGPSQLLDEWRMAERRLSARDPDAADFEDIVREVERLRVEFSGPAADDADALWSVDVGASGVELREPSFG